MRHKRLYLLAFSAPMLLLLSLLLPAHVVKAANVNMSVPATIKRNSLPTSTWSSYFAPYVYVMPGPSADSKPSSIIQAEQQTGVKYYTLAFIISQGCQAIWGDFTQPGEIPAGIPPGTPDPMMTAINQLRQLGGDVAISFGGANGIELGQACQDVPSLQKQYQSVIDAYKVTHLDFDVEGASVADTASVDRRNKAIAALEQANPNLVVSYTLPVMPTGLTSDGVNILKNALTNKARIDVVNVMTMDYGSSVPSNQMGKSAISAAQATESQLRQINMSAKIGITPMIGANDSVPETFTLDDAKQVAAFAKQNSSIGELSMWSLGRDTPCPGGATGSVSPTCSGIAQKSYDFVKLFSGFKGDLQGPPPPPNWFFPCSDKPNPQGGTSQVSEAVISKDWLSGDGGHFSNTYAADTYGFPQVSTLFGYMEVLAFVLITPSTLLLGYQIMMGASTFRYASALEGLSRVVLGGLAVAASFALVQMLINLENIVSAAIVLLHSEQPFPSSSAVTGVSVLYSLPGEPAGSYRAIVVPMSRWGCAINDFAGIFSATVVQDLASNIPLMSHFVPLAGSVKTMADLIHRLGEMGLMVLSILLWVQVFARILLLNYYILVAPLAFGCWGLPGGVGQNVVRLWAKGFLSVLFVQTVQLFILTTLPLILPPLPQSFVSLGGEGILQGLLLQFPPILTLCIMLMAPTLVGASISKALGSASSVTKGVVIAVGAGVGTGKRPVSRRRETGSEAHIEGQYIPGQKWTLTRRSREKRRISESRDPSFAYTKRGYPLS
jgi:Glycosyl hydrolases family 18